MLLTFYWIIIWLIDDEMLISICLFDDLWLGFITAIWYWKPVDYNSQQPSLLSYKRCSTEMYSNI